jgi:hypothetical protein
MPRYKTNHQECTEGHSCKAYLENQSKVLRFGIGLVQCLRHKHVKETEQPGKTMNTILA